MEIVHDLRKQRGWAGSVACPSSLLFPSCRPSSSMSAALAFIPFHPSMPLPQLSYFLPIPLPFPGIFRSRLSSIVLSSVLVFQDSFTLAISGGAPGSSLQSFRTDLWLFPLDRHLHHIPSSSWINSTARPKTDSAQASAGSRQSYLHG